MSSITLTKMLLERPWTGRPDSGAGAGTAARSRLLLEVLGSVVAGEANLSKASGGSRINVAAYPLHLCILAV